MPRNLTFGKKLGVGFTLCAAVLLAVAWVGRDAATSLIETDRLVAHTYKVRSTLAEVLRLSVDAETGQRGFLLTGAEAVLEPYEKALQSSSQTLAELGRLIADNP